MRHRKIGRQLSRNSSHRKATLQSLSNAVILNGGIKTTVAKAKELRRVVEPLVTRSKTDSVHNRRTVFARLRDDVTVGILFNELGPRYASRPGGYLRISSAVSGLVIMHQWLMSSLSTGQRLKQHNLLNVLKKPSIISAFFMPEALVKHLLKPMASFLRTFVVCFILFRCYYCLT